MNKKKAFNREGVIDPLSLIGLGILVFSLIVGTKVATDKERRLETRKEASLGALCRENGGDCFPNNYSCRYTFSNFNDCGTGNKCGNGCTAPPPAGGTPKPPPKCEGGAEVGSCQRQGSCFFKCDYTQGNEVGWIGPKGEGCQGSCRLDPTQTPTTQDDNDDQDEDTKPKKKTCESEGYTLCEQDKICKGNSEVSALNKGGGKCCSAGCKNPPPRPTPSPSKSPSPTPRVTATPTFTPTSSPKGSCHYTSSCSNIDRKSSSDCSSCIPSVQVCCGEKIENKCDKGTSYCPNDNSTSIFVCKSDKSGYESKTCTANTTCKLSEGKCVPKPTPTTTQTPTPTPTPTPNQGTGYNLQAGQTCKYVGQCAAKLTCHKPSDLLLGTCVGGCGKNGGIPCSDGCDPGLKESDGKCLPQYVADAPSSSRARYNDAKNQEETGLVNIPVRLNYLAENLRNSRDLLEQTLSYPISSTANNLAVLSNLNYSDPFQRGVVGPYAVADLLTLGQLSATTQVATNYAQIYTSARCQQNRFAKECLAAAAEAGIAGTAMASYLTSPFINPGTLANKPVSSTFNNLADNLANSRYGNRLFGNPSFVVDSQANITLKESTTLIEDPMTPLAFTRLRPTLKDIPTRVLSTDLERPLTGFINESDLFGYEPISRRVQITKIDTPPVGFFSSKPNSVTLDNGEVITLGEQIGSAGSQGSVFLGKRCTGELCAVKLFNPGSDFQDVNEQQLSILQNLGTSGSINLPIPQYYGSVVEGQRTVGYAMELVHGPTLKDLHSAGGITSQQAEAVIAAANRYQQGTSLPHGDLANYWYDSPFSKYGSINPGNVIFSPDGKVILIDPTGTSLSQGGTAQQYMREELLNLKKDLYDAFVKR